MGASAPAKPGSTTDRLVSFVDFAPTVLSLCGVKAPSHFQGSVFLGPDAPEPREFVYGARDRVDEAFDVARSVRDDRWLYIRNFMPHLPWMQPEAYSDASTFRRELKRLAPAVGHWKNSTTRRPTRISSIIWPPTQSTEPSWSDCETSSAAGSSRRATPASSPSRRCGRDSTARRRRGTSPATRRVIRWSVCFTLPMP